MKQEPRTYKVYRKIYTQGGWKRVITTVVADNFEYVQPEGVIVFFDGLAVYAVRDWDEIRIEGFNVTEEIQDVA